jgi:hypothetical protein
LKSFETSFILLEKNRKKKLWPQLNKTWEIETCAACAQAICRLGCVENSRIRVRVRAWWLSSLSQSACCGPSLVVFCSEDFCRGDHGGWGCWRWLWSFWTRRDGTQEV